VAVSDLTEVEIEGLELYASVSDTASLRTTLGRAILEIRRRRRRSPDELSRSELLSLYEAVQRKISDDNGVTRGMGGAPSHGGWRGLAEKLSRIIDAENAERDAAKGKG
jgi:hypothetical protein